jgi:EAL domain-containing protein (putative c-di-GMP-specific phosphodiesterase class I)
MDQSRMTDQRVLVGYRPVVHLATGTIVGWRLGRTRTPASRVALDEHLREAVCLMCDTLVATDRGRPSMRFAVIEARLDEAASLAEHTAWALLEYRLPGPRLGFVVPAADVLAAPEQHVHLRRLARLGVGVGVCDPTLEHAEAVLAQRLPVTRLRLPAPDVDPRSTSGTGARIVRIIGAARRSGVSVTISGIDSPEQQSAVRRAGADMGTGAALGAVTELPLLHLPRDHAALEAVQRLTVARRVRSASEWANAG